MKNRKRAIILFTRIPIAGKTKTRMMPFLTPEECAGLHECFIRDAYEACKKAEADIVVCYLPEGELQNLKKLFPEESIYLKQEGTDLGNKMKRAIAQTMEMGYEKVVLIGTDIPQITTKILNQALDDLDDSDIVINPTKDGGYYLIGMKEAHDEVWNVQRYGTNTVIEDTLAQMEKARLKVKIGSMCMDLDTEEDLRKLYLGSQEGMLPVYTGRYLREHLGVRLVEKMAEACVHCGLCTRNCAFLDKYSMDLQDFSKSPEKAYSCFLCRKCTEVCPKGISGEQIALQLRGAFVQKGNGAVQDKAYKGLLWEKNGYKFANYRKSKKKSVFMPGCNFSSFYPETTKKLEEIMRDHDIGILYECCGKPVYELGIFEEAEKNLYKIEYHLKNNGVEELVLLCPNCYHFMKGKIQIPIVTIYEKLKELGEGTVVHREKFPMYYPCPDRKERVLFEELRYFLNGEITEPFQNVQCCGLGGCAAVKEPELAESLTELAQSGNEQELYTYCASCISNFRRNGFMKSYHILPLILGVEEKVPLGIQPFFNRAKHLIL